MQLSRFCSQPLPIACSLSLADAPDRFHRPFMALGKYAMLNATQGIKLGFGAQFGIEHRQGRESVQT